MTCWGCVQMRELLRVRAEKTRMEAAQNATENNENMVLYREGFRVMATSQTDAITRGINWFEVVPPGEIEP